MDTDFKQQLNSMPKFEENILKAFENRKLVFFIGAGVSRIMGVPGWDAFSARLIKKAFPSYKEHSTILKEIPNSKERITIAYNKFHSDGKLKEFYSCFGENMQPDPQTFASKENIYEILNSFDATFLTTNADNLFEEVIGSALCHENCDVAILNNELSKYQNRLFYLHGHYTDDIDINDNNLVFTAPQYVRRYNEHGFAEFLRTIFHKDNVIVFIGYGLNEFELIDYMMTKSGYTKESDRKVYLLYGFCDNEEILYKAKSAYFEELNIGLIEYNISNNGYDSLIDVLKMLLAQYRENTIVPVAEKITYCTNNYSEENYAEIVRLLKNEHLAHTNEPQITHDLQEQKNHIWTKRLYEDGLFSSSRLSEKIEYRAWPLLELLAEWVETGERDAQSAALSFLKSINAEQTKKLSEGHSHINSSIVRIILALSNSHITSAHIAMLENIGKGNNLFYHELPRISNYSRVATWSKSILNKFLNLIFEKVNLDEFQDNMSYSIKHFFKHLNKYVGKNSFSKNLFEYLVNLVVEASKPDSYCLFLRLYDLDHIKKNHQEHWTAIFDEINLIFSKLDKKIQKKKITDLISSDNNARIKLGLYLARKTDLNVSSSILDAKFFSSYDYYHECYLLIKHLTLNGYLCDEQSNRLEELISTANFGIDNYTNFNRDEYFTQLITSKRLLLLQLLPGDKCKKSAQELEKSGVKPYPSEETARECDYVHSVEWHNETFISAEMFHNIPFEDWCLHFEELCANHTDDYSLSSCCRQFAQILIEKSKDDFSAIISNLKKIKLQLVAVILYELRSNRDKLSAQEYLVKSCLEILDVMIKRNTIDLQCAKSIFSTLSDIDIQDEIIVKATIKSVIPWLNQSIDEGRTFDDDNHVLNNLINYGDYEKLSVLLNCFITLKKLCNYTLSDEEINLLMDATKNDSIRNTYKYTLCFNYQNLKYIAPQKYITISNAILNEKPLDIVALAMCILNSNYVFNELVEKIKSEYLYGNCTLPESCKDRILSDHFYSYIISSRYFNVLSQEEFEKAYKDIDFLKYFLRNIRIWSEKDDFQLSEWIVPCWKYIKTNFDDDLLAEFAENVLHTIEDVKVPTKDLLELYLEAAEKCNKRYCVYANIPKVLSFFEVDTAKAESLIYKIFALDGYTKYEDIELVIAKYKEYGLTREASKLLIMLSERGEISNKTKESLAELLN